eukprot:Rhum_TRINITY_DN14313_c0_g1::Rhum_TRINITY_DN14313_c0_g1_i5::g.79852::m.79852
MEREATVRSRRRGGEQRGGIGAGDGMSEVRDALHQIKVRRDARRADAFAGKSNMLEVLQTVMPYVTVVCMAPILYMLYTMLVPAGPAAPKRSEQLLTQILTEVQQLREELRDLSESDRCPLPP